MVPSPSKSGALTFSPWVSSTVFGKVLTVEAKWHLVSASLPLGQVGETGPNRVLGGGVPGRLDVCLQARIPTLEGVPEVVVQDLRADLQQQVRPPLGPTHLLFLDHPLADHLIHRRFHERRRDRLAVAIAIPVVGDEGLVDLDVVMEFLQP